MKHRIVCIIPARSDSSRLPKKHLKSVKNIPMIGILISRMKTIKEVDEVIVATTQRKIDDELSSTSLDFGASVFRGSLKDVIGRFAKAAKESRATICIKANGDNPLQAPEIIDIGIKQLLSKNLDLVTGKNIFTGIPVGLGAEVLSYQTVEWLDKHTPLEYREDTTNYLFNTESNINLEPIIVEEQWKKSKETITIDTQNDLDKLRKIVSILPKQKPKNWNITQIIGAMNKYEK